MDPAAPERTPQNLMMERPARSSDLPDILPVIVGLANLPDELLLRILAWLDVPDLMAVSRVSHHFRRIALDPLLHAQRLRACSTRLSLILPHRPPLHRLQPPVSYIYLSRTHVAARKLGFSLALVAVNRSLSRRPPLSSLVNANIVPKDCCRRDRQSGQMLIATAGILERKRKVEREKVKEGLRVWLERKAREIGRKKDIGVGILAPVVLGAWERPETGRVRGLQRFWEDMGDAHSVQ